MLSYFGAPTIGAANATEAVMDESCQTGDSTRPAALVLELERSCDRFEAQCRAGLRPRIEEFLVGMKEPSRSRLLRELLTLDLTYRRKAGERPAPVDYRGRLTGDGALVDSVFRGAPDGGSADRETADSAQANSDPAAQAEPTAIGKYLVVARLDQGGQGQVFRVVHPELRKDMVLKLARDCVGADAEAALVSEGRLLAQIEHPNLVRVFDLDFHEGRPYVVMEYLAGTNLQQFAMESRPGVRLRRRSWLSWRGSSRYSIVEG